MSSHDEASIDALIEAVKRDPAVTGVGFFEDEEPVIDEVVKATVRRLGVVAGREQASRERRL